MRRPPSAPCSCKFTRPWNPSGLMLLAVPLAATLAVSGIVLVMISRRPTPDIGYDTRH